jgi:S1-C subfamily serine protease
MRKAVTLMDVRILKTLGVVVVLLLVLGAGTAAAGVAYREYHEGDLFTFDEEDQEVDPDAGLIVTTVDPDGPASEIGVVRGDILLKIGDHGVNSARDLRAVLGDLKPGDKVSLTILHGSELRKPEVTLGERDDRPYLGISLCCGLGERLSMNVVPSIGPALLIVEVLPDTPAEDAGLKKGDLILAVDGKELIESVDFGDIIRAYEPGDRITLEIEDIETGEIREVSVQLSEHPEFAGQAYLGVRYRFRLHRILGDDIPWSELPSDVLPHGEWHLLLPDSDEQGFWFFAPGFRQDQFPPFDERQPLPPGFEGNEFYFSVPPFRWDWFFDTPEDEVVEGVVILQVVEGSPADEAGLQENDVITAVYGDAVGDSASIKQAVTSRRPGDSIKLTVYRPEMGKRIGIEVRLGEHPDDPGTAYLGVELGPYIHLEHHEDEGNMPSQIPNLRPVPTRTSTDT